MRTRHFTGPFGVEVTSDTAISVFPSGVKTVPVFLGFRVAAATLKFNHIQSVSYGEDA